MITKDGLGVTKADEVIAKRLGCGHVVGGEDYKTFVDESRKIEVAAMQEIQDAQKAASAKKAALWKGIQAKKGVN
jgi:hypothetical protein